MNKPIDVFKSTFIYSLGVILLGSLTLRIYPFIFALFTSSEPLNVALWGISTFHSSLILSLFSLVIPWLLLSFYGEYFYTRSYNRKDIFQIIKNLHIKYLALITGLMVINVYVYNTFSNEAGDKLYLIPSMFFVSLTIYISLVIAGNTSTLKKILLYGLPLFLVLAFSQSYYINGYEITRIIFWSLWVIYLIVVYRVVAFYNDDIDLNVPGRADDENRARANMWIFNKEFGGNNAKISKPGMLSQFNMLTSHTANIYKQLFLIMNIVLLFFIIRFSYGYIISEMPAYSDASDGVNIFLAFLSFCFMGIFIFINPKYIIRQAEEFLFTRAVSKGKIYITNFLYQGLFVLLLASIDLLVPNLNLTLKLDMINVILIALWFYIAGEIGIILLLTLFISDFTFATLNSNLSISLSTSLIVNIISPTFNAFLIWGTAILFRVSDYLWFINKEIGYFKDWKKMLLSLSKLYGLIFLACISLSVFSAYSNPFTNFLNNQKYHKYHSWYEFNSNILLAIVKNEKDTYEKALYGFISDPYNPEKYLKLSRDFFINDLKIYYRPYKIYMSVEENFLPNIETLLNMSESLKDTPEYLYQKSIVEKNKDNYKEALLLAKKSVEKSNDNNYLFNLGSIYQHEFMNKEAIEMFNKIALSKDNNFKVLRRIGNIYWDNKNYNQAIDYYAKATSNDLSIFPYKNYYSLGLCNKLNQVANTSNVFQNRYIKADLGVDLNLCFDKKIDPNTIYLYNYRHKNNSYYESGDALYIDRAKKAEDKGDLIESKSILKKNLYLHEKTISGYLALTQIKLGKKEDAEKTINNYLLNQSKSKNKLRDKTFDISFTDYDANIYKAMLMLSNYPDKNLIAQKMLLSSSDTQKAFNELKNLVSIDELKKLELLKNQYEELYNYFENNGLSMIKNAKNVERTSILLDKLDSKNRSRFSEVIKVLEVI